MYIYDERGDAMEGPKGWREFCRMAGTATLKFETDKHELLEVTIFADRTSCRDSLWMASFQYGNGLSIITLSGDADSDAYEDSILCKMAELSNAVMDGSPIYSPYGITFSPVSYVGEDQGVLLPPEIVVLYRSGCVRDCFPLLLRRVLLPLKSLTGTRKRRFNKRFVSGYKNTEKDRKVMSE